MTSRFLKAGSCKPLAEGQQAWCTPADSDEAKRIDCIATLSSSDTAVNGLTRGELR